MFFFFPLSSLCPFYIISVFLSYCIYLPPPSLFSLYLSLSLCSLIELLTSKMTLVKPLLERSVLKNNLTSLNYYTDLFPLSQGMKNHFLMVQIKRITNSMIRFIVHGTKPLTWQLCRTPQIILAPYHWSWRICGIVDFKAASLNLESLLRADGQWFWLNITAWILYWHD